MNEDQNTGESNEPELPDNSSQNKSPISTGMLVTGALVLVVALGGIVTLANRGSNTTNSNAQNTQSTAPESTISPMVEGTETGEVAGDTVNISLEAGSFYFTPKEIRVKKGQTVKITMTAKDMMHDFNIDELGVKIPLTKSGQTSSVEFIASKAGTFEYYCSVGQHRKMGQIGTIIITE